MNAVAFTMNSPLGDGLQKPVTNPTNYNNNTVKCANSSDDDAVESPTASMDSGAESPLPHNSKEPEPNSIKMFVGQIPKNMEESELREMFSKYGEIYQLNVLRDKVTGQHRGCCFVTFYTRKSAIMAQDALHGRQTLSGMHHPIQMKPADNEKKNVEDRKLFIGMISKKLSENDIRGLFNQFGSIEDCMILRDTSGVSRGCAFVTFAVRQSAINAIQHMHHSQTMEGCSSPLVVKFADTQKDKDTRTKLLPTNNNIIQTSPFPAAGLPSLSPNYISLYQQSLNPNGMNLTGLQNGIPNLSDITTLQNMHNLQSLQGLQNMAYLTQNTGLYNNQSLLGLPAIATPQLTSARTLASPTTGASLPLNTMAASFPHAYASVPTALAADSPAGKQTEGPDGANLFIYHLPQEFLDQDLLQAFMPFGAVVSAKVFIDKQTNLSKCFGFVSFDNPLSAQAAIATMNGFQIGMKRLKVQLKRPKNESKPYW